MTSPNMLPKPAPACSAPPTRPYRRLTQAQLGIILALSKDGKTQAQVAQAIGCTQQAISDALKTLGVDTLDLARHRATASAYRRVKRLDGWTKKRDAIGLKAAQELNEIAGLTGTGDSKGVNVGVQVIIGQHGSPAGADPLGGESPAIIVQQLKHIERSPLESAQDGDRVG